MGEGNTPLFRLRNLEKILAWKGELWAKAEYLNPTGSFKDRGSITEISYAIAKKKKGVVCASTGNMAASLAAYAARAGISCIVVVPKDTPDSKLTQTNICNARIIKISGSYDGCVQKATDHARENNYLLCGDYELRRSGQRFVGYELAMSNISFDGFVCPVGNGTLGCAIADGFSSYGKSPRFIGVQGFGADPIVQAWNKNSSIMPMIEPKTVATAIKVGNPLDGILTLAWVKKTNGTLISIPDNDIFSAQKLIAQTEGIFIETSAAVTVACLAKTSQVNQRLVLIITGSGLKEAVMSS